jgi:hypothetical protein
MKRGGLFFIGLISAIATIISLNIAFGRSAFYDHYKYYDRYHHCYHKYDDRFRDDKNSNDDRRKGIDSTKSNY